MPKARPERLTITRALACAVALVVAVPALGQVPGTRVSLDPPPGFSPAGQFPGFRKADVSASIVVTEMPGPVTAITAGLTAEGLATRGMTLLGSEEATISGRPARLLRVSQTAQGVVFEKWMLAFGSAEHTVLVVGTFPRDSADDLREPIKQSLLTTRWNLESTPGTFDGLRFRVEETATLRIAGRVSNNLMLTKGGVKGPLPAGEPLLVVGSSMGGAALTDVAEFARRRLAQIEQITEAQNVTGEAVTVDGLPAYELTADGQDARTGVPLRIYQLVVSEQTGYFLAQGFVGRQQAAEFEPQFRQVARSLRRVQ